MRQDWGNVSKHVVGRRQLAGAGGFRTWRGTFVPPLRVRRYCHSSRDHDTIRGPIWTDRTLCCTETQRQRDPRLPRGATASIDKDAPTATRQCGGCSHALYQQLVCTHTHTHKHTPLCSVCWRLLLALPLLACKSILLHGGKIKNTLATQAAHARTSMAACRKTAGGRTGRRGRAGRQVVCRGARDSRGENVPRQPEAMNSRAE